MRSVDWIGFDHVALTLRERWMVSNVKIDGRPHHERIFATHLDDHPMIAHARGEHDYGAAKFSDFVRDKDWRYTTLCNGFYREVCGEHQIPVPITMPGRNFYGLVFYRSRRDFGESDREILHRLCPYVSHCIEKSSALERARRSLAEGREAYELGGRFLLWVDPPGRLARTSPEARHRLGAVFPEWGGAVGPGLSDVSGDETPDLLFG